MNTHDFFDDPELRDDRFDDEDDSSGAYNPELEEQALRERREVEARARRASAAPAAPAVLASAPLRPPPRPPVAHAIGAPNSGGRGFAVGGQSLQLNTAVPWPKLFFLCQELGITPGPVTCFIAFGFSGKSILAQHCGLCVGSGKPILGLYAVQKGPVVHLDYEQGWPITDIRYRRLQRGAGIMPSDMFGTGVQYYRPTMKLDDPAAESELEALLQEKTLCIIDSYRAAISCDENDSKAREPLDMLGRVSENTRCVILVIHHAGKGTFQQGKHVGRGSSAIFDAQGSSFNLEKAENSDIYTLTRTKSRAGGKPFGVSYTMNDLGLYVPDINATEQLVLAPVVAPPPVPLDQQIIDALKSGPRTAGDIRRAVGKRDAEVGRCLRELEERGEVVLEEDPKDGRKKQYRRVE